MKDFFSSRVRVGLTAATVGLLAACGKNEPPPPPPAKVEATVAEVRNLPNSMEFIGQIVPYFDANLVARVKGFLIKKNFASGNPVKKGDLLFSIEKDQYQARLDAAEASLAQANAELQKAEIDYTRQKTLYEKDAVAKQELDNATCERDTAKANVMAAKADVREANLNLGYTDVLAPFDGFVGFTDYDVGNMVGPSSGTLANIVSGNPVYAQFNISESILVSAMQGGKWGRESGNIIPTLTLSNGTEYPLKGKMDIWNNQIDSMTGTIAVRTIFDNPDNLLTPGAYVKVTLTSVDKQPRILVPQAAVISSLSGNCVMLIDKNGGVTRSWVETGGRFGENVEIKSGVGKGDIVIYQGAQKVKTGEKVAATITPLAEIAAKPKHPDNIGTNPPAATATKTNAVVKTNK